MATAPPTKDSISGSGSTPSNAQARAGFGAIHDNLYGVGGLLGSTGLTSDARNGLGIGSVISFRNLLINGNFSVNQRVYASGTATTAANQYTLDRWRVVVSGQSLTFGAATPDRVVTAPAGGIEQPIEGLNIVGGVYTLSWEGTATATVNGTAITNGGQTAALPAGANATIRFSGGTVGRTQFELGTVATPFERRPVGLELLLSQRYYLLFTGGGSGVCTSSGAEYTVNFPATMRTPPTYVNGGNGAIVDGLGALTVTGGSMSGSNQTNARLAVSASGTTAGRGANVVNQTSLFNSEI